MLIRRKQDKNTFKSIEFSEGDEQISLLTVSVPLSYSDSLNSRTFSQDASIAPAGLASHVISAKRGGSPVCCHVTVIVVNRVPHYRRTLYKLDLL